MHKPATSQQVGPNVPIDRSFVEKTRNFINNFTVEGPGNFVWNGWQPILRIDRPAVSDTDYPFKVKVSGNRLTVVDAFVNPQGPFDRPKLNGQFLDDPLAFYELPASPADSEMTVWLKMNLQSQSTGLQATRYVADDFPEIVVDGDTSKTDVGPPSGTATGEAWFKITTVQVDTVNEVFTGVTEPQNIRWNLRYRWSWNYEHEVFGGVVMGKVTPGSTTAIQQTGEGVDLLENGTDLGTFSCGTDDNSIVLQIDSPFDVGVVQNPVAYTSEPNTGVDDSDWPLFGLATSIRFFHPAVMAEYMLNGPNLSLNGGTYSVPFTSDIPNSKVTDFYVDTSLGAVVSEETLTYYATNLPAYSNRRIIQFDNIGSFFGDPYVELTWTGGSQTIDIVDQVHGFSMESEAAGLSVTVEVYNADAVLQDTFTWDSTNSTRLLVDGTGDPFGDIINLQERVYAPKLRWIWNKTGESLTFEAFHPFATETIVIPDGDTAVVDISDSPSTNFGGGYDIFQSPTNTDATISTDTLTEDCEGQFSEIWVYYKDGSNFLYGPVPRPIVWPYH